MGKQAQALCRDKRPCFARNGKVCVILRESYMYDGECPFCKAPDKHEDDRIKSELKGVTK